MPDPAHCPPCCGSCTCNACQTCSPTLYVEIQHSVLSWDGTYELAFQYDGNPNNCRWLVQVGARYLTFRAQVQGSGYYYQLSSSDGLVWDYHVYSGDPADCAHSGSPALALQANLSLGTVATQPAISAALVYGP